MCEIMDNLYKKKAKEDRKQMVVEMLKDGKLSYEDIAKYSGLTLEEVKALAEGQPA